MALKSRFVAAAFAFLLGTSAALAADVAQTASVPRTVADITQLLTAYTPDAKRVEEVRRLRAILDGQPPQSSDREELARFYLKLATAAGDLGALTRQIAFMNKVIELGGVEDLDNHFAALRQLQARAGNWQETLETSEKNLIKNPYSVGAWATKAFAFAQLGDFESAKSALARTESQAATQMNNPRLYSKWRHNFVFIREFTRAAVWSALGKYDGVEGAMRLAIDAAEEDVKISSWRIGTGDTAVPQNVAESRPDDYRAIAARMMVDQGRLTEGEQLARQAYLGAEKRTGASSVQTSTVLAKLTYVFLMQGRFSEAEKIIRLALKNLTDELVLPDSNAVVELRKNLGTALVAQGRYAEAISEFQTILAAYDAFPLLRQRMAAGHVNWSLALLKTGQYREALNMTEGLISKSRDWLGASHIDTAELVGINGMILGELGDTAGAVAAYRSVLPILLNALINPGDEPSPLRVQRLKTITEHAISLLGSISGTPLEMAIGIDAAGEGFRIADALRSQTTQSAVAASALRAAANDPKIGAEIRKEQDLAQEMAALFRIVRDLMNAPEEKQLSKTIGDMKARIETIKTERANIQADIEKRFPAYANLIRPQPPSLAETRAVLRSGEALINIFSSDTATYLWAFKNDGAVAFASTKVNREELARRVQGLRKALDPGDAELARGIPDFDLDAAYRLYADLLLPVAAGWQGATTLLVASNGALSQLPLALLPTQKVAVKADPKLPYGQFKDVPWLIRQAAFTQLPSVNALVALRKLPAASAERAAFVGFGDPQFSDSPIQVASRRGRLRNLSIARPSLRDVEQGKAAEWMDYGKIPPLPDTREEILALAQALKANPEADVFLGSKASKENLKKLDLAKRKVVAFATHGLLAGDFPGISEPSLALANPGGGKHGLLTLEDILGLKLDADWVVLSACNTAGGDGQGADALSGLGRGFFYAGSRALLVTHWPVESVSAKTLVTGIFERQAADPRLSRTEALRQSMLALMQAKSTDNAFSYAHPLFWAPYALVGEGGI